MKALLILLLLAPTLQAANCRTLVSIRADNNLMTGTLHSHFRSCAEQTGKTIEIELWRALFPPKKISVTSDVHSRYLRTIASAQQELERLTAKRESRCAHPVRVEFPDVKKEFYCCSGDSTMMVAQALDDMIFTLAER